MVSTTDAQLTPGPFGAGRFAPSPSGELHLGNLRTALLAWLAARSSGRRFLVRIEDLDRDRTVPGAAEKQLADLASLGLDWDPPVWVQSERFAVYAEAVADLAARGLQLRPRQREVGVGIDRVERGHHLAGVDPLA